MGQSLRRELIVWAGQAKNFVEVSKSDDKKLTCDYWFKGLRGNAIFTKKGNPVKFSQKYNLIDSNL